MNRRAFLSALPAAVAAVYAGGRWCLARLRGFRMHGDAIIVSNAADLQPAIDTACELGIPTVALEPGDYVGPFVLPAHRGGWLTITSTNRLRGLPQPTKDWSRWPRIHHPAHEPSVVRGPLPSGETDGAHCDINSMFFDVPREWYERFGGPVPYHT